MSVFIRMLAGVLRKLGPERAASVLHEVRRSDPAASEALARAWLEMELPDGVVGAPYLRHYAAKFLGPLDLRMEARVTPEELALLEEIPTETTLAERLFLREFFATVWSGRGHVVESGPFLGGTTRAMAMGMAANPARTPDARLITLDKFKSYYDVARLRELLGPLLQRRPALNRVLDARSESTEFLSVFNAVHQDQPYASFVDARSCLLPNAPAEAAQAEARVTDIAGRGNVSAIFVDGCKSWYSTKWFLLRLLEGAREPVWIIFQDYLHFTCFWIPCVVEMLGTTVRPTHSVSMTRAFVCVSPPAAVARLRDIPDDPGIAERELLERTFASILARVQSDRDVDALVRHTIQRAGAMAYAGDMSGAGRMLEQLRASPIALGYETLFAQAQSGITYRPDGAVIKVGGG